MIRLLAKRPKHKSSYCKQGEVMLVKLCWRSGKLLLNQFRQYDSMTLTKIVLVFISKTHFFRIMKRISQIA
jgi:hypothetical protein